MSIQVRLPAESGERVLAALKVAMAAQRADEPAVDVAPGEPVVGIAGDETLKSNPHDVPREPT